MAEFKFGKLSKPARNYIRGSDAFLNIAVGSIRSGKTITALMKFLAFISESPHTHFAIAGKTINTIKRNVIEPLTQMLNYFEIDYTYNHSNNEIIIGSNVLSLFGIEKEGADEKIQGFTCGGSLVDEATVIPESGFRMLLSRNSLEGARIFCTCNPSNPNHYIYKDYVNNQKLLDSGRCKVFNFLLDENPHLSREYVENLKAMYPRDSVFYKRYILNQWVSGQGAIYDQFTNENIYTSQCDLSEYDYLEIGSDYGTSTTTCYTLIGIKEYKDHNTYDVIYEYGFDAKREGVTQTDAQRVDDIYEIQEKFHLTEDNTFYCSHDAASLLSALEKDPRIKMTLDTYKPDTLECIQELSTLFYNNNLRIHESCKETIKQVQGYEWDMKAASKGVDKPVKKDDHYPDALRAPVMNHLYSEDMVYSDLVYI